MTNGCPQCEHVDEDHLYLDCQIEQADSDVCRAMNELERLRRKKQKLEQELKQKGTQCHQYMT